MDQVEIDVERLITLVKERPVLWDKSQEEYSSMNASIIAWRDIYQELCPKFLSLSNTEKNKIGKLVTKKWRNVKDSWLKDQKRCNGKRYKYEKQLTFLKKNISQKELYPGLGEDSSSQSGQMENKKDEAQKSGVRLRILRPAPSGYRRDLEASRKRRMGGNHERATSKHLVATSKVEEPKPFATGIILREAEASIAKGTQIICSPTLSGTYSVHQPTLPETYNVCQQTLPKTHNIHQQTLPDTYNTQQKVQGEKKQKLTDIEKGILKNLEILDNRHILFIRGILPMLQKLDEEQTLQFQVGVLNVLQNIQSATAFHEENRPSYPNEEEMIEDLPLPIIKFRQDSEASDNATDEQDKEDPKPEPSLFEGLVTESK
ncbi:uncharacterized protein [Palaemon carinicauda]|uniref:uncharacterized protein n=1 Tax=Palaemon carinicauda TaxID=392227 RepID=UPI0035B5F838